MGHADRSRWHCPVSLDAESWRLCICFARRTAAISNTYTVTNHNPNPNSYDDTQRNTHCNPICDSLCNSDAYFYTQSNAQAAANSTFAADPAVDRRKHR